MSSDFQHYSFRMPNIGFQNLPLNIYIVVFGTAIFVFILSLLFCCYLIRLRHQAHKELYAYKQVILKEKVKELNLHEAFTGLQPPVFLGHQPQQLRQPLLAPLEKSPASFGWLESVDGRRVPGKAQTRGGYHTRSPASCGAPCEYSDLGLQQGVEPDATCCASTARYRSRTASYPNGHGLSGTALRRPSGRGDQRAETQPV
ncbi:PREDICTED: RING finger protein 24 [Pygoscelis adeliae]|uniref:RING finger protein 24 n=1 Tax=Pygoscelis adeliae TaxID=9238 RepID=UPI0004F4E49D|nr:PREDICTED: RING finger protein 24 [Pygoscelis adeliae]